MTDRTALMDVRDLQVSYRVGQGRRLHAVDGVDLTVAEGEVLCIVGESGSGKSTIGKAVLGLIPASGGAIDFDGIDMTTLRGRALRRLRARMQMIFQDPYASLDPRMTVGEIIAEPLAIHSRGGSVHHRERLLTAMRDVGLMPALVDSYPHELSGGQRQRVGIARALILEPALVVADEPVAALDVSIQAQVVNLLQDLQRSRKLTLIVISHDLAVVRHLADRVAVMYSGRIVEYGDRESIYEHPAHPYTRALLSAAPIPDPAVERERERIVLEGEPPSPFARPDGCRFSSRCPLRAALGNPDICAHEDPRLTPVVERPDHTAACHFIESDRGEAARGRASVHHHPHDQGENRE
ncbi:MAG TPA: oligopeptide/dipeptide ABC transporter ATP-binding protein [Gryllotalpicola sp.]